MDRLAGHESGPVHGRGRGAGEGGPRRGRRYIDHLGIAVKDLAAAVRAYEALGFHVEAEHEVPTEKVKTAFLPVGESHLELLEPTDPSSVIAKFLEKRAGLHHVCIAVPDIQAELDALKAKGVRAPGPGAARRGRAAARWRSCIRGPPNGVLLELVERKGI